MPKREDLIEFGFEKCALGWALVAGCAKGICALFMGDSRAAMEAELAARFPKAALQKGGAIFQKKAAQIAKAIDGKKPWPPFALDLRGTPFQIRVWTALRQIPAGKNWSYTELARRAGRPKAVRAVASACGANPVAVLIPCHRVLRKDGSLGGYRWGLARKKALLAREGAAFQA